MAYINTVPPAIGTHTMTKHLASSTSGSLRLLENLLSLYLLQGLNYLLPMLALPYLIRVLGVGVYGLVAFSQAFAQYFVILTDYGFNLSATRFIAQHRDDPEQVRSMFWQVMILKCSLASLGLGILIILVLFIPRLRQDAQYLLWAYLLVLGNVLFPQWYFQGLERMRYISICTGFAKILSTLLLFLYIRRPADGVLAVVIQSGGMLIAGVLGFGVALRSIGVSPVLPSFATLRKTLSDGWHLFVSMAAVSLYTNTNLVLVGLLAGNIQAGYFSVAEKLVRAVTGLISPASQVFFPRINSFVMHSREVALQSVSRILRVMAAVTFALSLSLLAFSEPLAALIMGSSAAQGSISVMRWIAFLPFFIGISNVLGLQTMLPFGLDRQFSRILIASGILNILAGVPLIYWLGARGAGISVLITEVCVTLTMMISLRANHISILRLRKAQ